MSGVGGVSVDGLRALEQAALPAPWEQVWNAPDNGLCDVWTEEDPASVLAQVVPVADAALIVAARNALPGLLGRVEAAEAERDALRTAVERLRRIEMCAVDLYEAVEMAESVGLCLPDRVSSLALRDALNEPGAVLAASVPSGPAAAGRTTSKETQ